MAGRNGENDSDQQKSTDQQNSTDAKYRGRGSVTVAVVDYYVKAVAKVVTGCHR
ncbi:hypothetical protein MPTK2_7g00770 [Marchantia polymorpha subsp. ruderalis]